MVLCGGAGMKSVIKVENDNITYYINADTIVCLEEYELCNLYYLRIRFINDNVTQLVFDTEEERKKTRNYIFEKELEEVE